MGLAYRLPGVVWPCSVKTSETITTTRTMYPYSLYYPYIIIYFYIEVFMEHGHTRDTNPVVSGVQGVAFWCGLFISNGNMATAGVLPVWPFSAAVAFTGQQGTRKSHGTYAPEKGKAPYSGRLFLLTNRVSFRRSACRFEGSSRRNSASSNPAEGERGDGCRVPLTPGRTSQKNFSKSVALYCSVCYS